MTALTFRIGRVGLVFHQRRSPVGRIPPQRLKRNGNRPTTAAIQHGQVYEHRDLTRRQTEIDLCAFLILGSHAAMIHEYVANV